MNSNLSLQWSAHGWTEMLLRRCHRSLLRLERAARRFSREMDRDLGEVTHEVQVRRLAAHGCNGQALI